MSADEEWHLKDTLHGLYFLSEVEDKFNCQRQGEGEEKRYLDHASSASPFSLGLSTLQKNPSSISGVSSILCLFRDTSYPVLPLLSISPSRYRVPAITLLCDWIETPLPLML